jgi:hypothetical protein
LVVGVVFRKELGDLSLSLPGQDEQPNNGVVYRRLWRTKSSSDEIECAKSGIFGPFFLPLGKLRRQKWLAAQKVSNVAMAISKSDALACPRGVT